MKEQNKGKGRDGENTRKEDSNSPGQVSTYIFISVQVLLEIPPTNELDF